MHEDWRRQHFAMMSDGGLWAVPRSGLIFVRHGDELVLEQRMPWMTETAYAFAVGKDVPADAEALREYQDADYELIREHFEAGRRARPLGPHNERRGEADMSGFNLSDGDTGGFPVVWRVERDGVTAEVHAEEYMEEHFSPRDDCANLGTMVCWHPDYYLGDEQMTDADGRGALTTIFSTETGRTDFRDMRTVERYLRVARGAIVTIPLYLYDHSGISMSAGAPNPFDNPRIRRDEYGTGLGWDSSMVGFIYTTREQCAELCGTATDGGLYAPADYDGPALDWIVEQLRAEVDLYDRYLKGEVYFWRTCDSDGDTIDSCGGYLPDVSANYDAELDYVKQEALEALEAEVSERGEAAERERSEAARWVNCDVATVSA